MMYHSSDLLRTAQVRMQTLQREAAVQRQRPSYRQRLATMLISVARWLEPDGESVPAPELLSR